MRHHRRCVVPASLMTATILLLAGCGWQPFENIQVKANPTYQAQGGTGQQIISELSIFDEIETGLGSEFDESSRSDSNPYTYTGQIRPVRVNVNDFLDETGINQTVQIDDVAFGGVNVGAIGIPGSSGDIAVSETDGSASVPGLDASVPDVTGFVSAIIGTGTFTVEVGDASGTELPDGTYTLTVTIGGENGSQVTQSETLNGSGTLSTSVSLETLEIVNQGTVTVDVSLDWNDVAADTTGIPVVAGFDISQFSELVVDVGTDFLSGFGIDPVAIEEDLRRQVEQIEIDTIESDIILRVSADLPTSLTITLESAELFTDAGGQSRVIQAGTTDEQQLTFDINEGSPIVFQDPDTAPDGGIESLDMSVTTDLGGYDDVTGHLTLTNVNTTETINASLANASIDVALEVASVTLRHLSDFFTDFTESIGGESLTFLGDLPGWFRFDTVPVRFGIQGLVSSGTPPTLDIAFTGYDEDVGGTAGVSETITNVSIGDANLSQADLATLFNSRPARIDIDISASGGDTTLTLSPGDFLEVVVELDLVFAFGVDNGGQPANVLAEFLEEDAFSVEGDLLDRESEDDLEDVFTNLESARLYLTIGNTSGLDGLSFSVRQPDPNLWTLADGNLDGELRIDLSQEDIRRIQTTYPFTPEVRLFLAEGGYELNYDGAISFGLRLELTADVDYTFAVFGQEE